MAKCGMPTMALKKENCFAVLMEAFSERASSDPDVDRSKANENRYGTNPELITTESGRELAEWFCKRADEYRVIDKNGHEKKLRSDASIAFAGIVKPDMEYINSLSRAEQTRFLHDANEVLTGILSSKKLTLVGVALHFDELAPHLHYVAYDKEYKLGKKLGLPLFNQLNHEFPQKMREKGWELQDLGRYDVEAAKLMTPEERETYKEKCIADKKEAKKHGQTSKQFKANQDIERAEKAVAYAKQREEEANRELARIEAKKKAIDQEIENAKEELQKEIQKVEFAKADLSKAKSEFRTEVIRFDRKKEELKNVEQYAENRAKEIFKAMLPQWIEDIALRAANLILMYAPKMNWYRAVEDFAAYMEVHGHIPNLTDKARQFIQVHFKGFTKTYTKKTIEEYIRDTEGPSIDEDPDLYFGP